MTTIDLGRPGDDYNRRADIPELLISHGWKLDGVTADGNQHWTRPGKNSGTSATLKSIDGVDVLHVFTPNATPLEADESYAPFTLYALFEHKGDFGAAASALAACGFGEFHDDFSDAALQRFIANSSRSKDDDGLDDPLRPGEREVGQSFKTKVEALVAAKTMGESEDHQTAQWVADLPDPMHAKIAKAGLVEPREVRDDTLAGLIDRFVEQADVTNATLAAYRQTTKSLLDFFGGALLVSQLTESDADEWRQSLVESKLAKATISKRIKVAKNIMGKAVRWSMIDRSPFADLPAGSQVNSDNSVYVSRDTIAKALDACPSAYTGGPLWD